MENSTPCKYKTVKDIEKPCGIYHYVADSSCCAKLYRNRITHFGWANRGSFSFFTYKHIHTHTLQTDKQIFSSRLQVTNMDQIEHINAHYTWFQVQMCILGVSTMINYFRGPDPQNRKFGGVNNQANSAKNSIPYIFKTVYQISTEFDRLM